jgi:hypothetical protein
MAASGPHGPRDTPAVPTREAPAITFMDVPEVRELIQTVKDLAARVAALEDGTRGPTRATPSPAGTRGPTRGSTSSNGPCDSRRRSLTR